MSTQLARAESISQEQRLAFFKQLQEVTNSIHSTSNIDEIMLEVSRDICRLCGCARLTLYAVNETKSHIETKVKIGMNSFKDFKLPITDSSIAGFVALTKRMVNIHDVYDQAELRTISPSLRFEQKVDIRTGFHTKEMVATPIVKADNGELLGVLQLINHVQGGPFTCLIEEGARELCKTLAIAFEQRMKAPMAIHTKYDPLAALGFLAKAELVLAARSARRKGVELEEVLLDEFQVKPEAIGFAYSKYFEVHYEPFRPDRARSKLLDNFKREYVENNEWLVLEDTPDGLTILALDPENLEASRIVHNLFPKAQISYRVTTEKEFRQTVDQLYGERKEAAPDPAQVLLERIQRIITTALGNNAPEVQVRLEVLDKPVATKASDGSPQSLAGQTTIHFRVDVHQ